MEASTFIKLHVFVVTPTVMLYLIHLVGQGQVNMTCLCDMVTNDSEMCDKITKMCSNGKQFPIKLSENEELPKISKQKVNIPPNVKFINPSRINRSFIEDEEKSWFWTKWVKRPHYTHKRAQISFIIVLTVHVFLLYTQMRCLLAFPNSVMMKSLVNDLRVVQCLREEQRPSSIQLLAEQYSRHAESSGKILFASELIATLINFLHVILMMGFTYGKFNFHRFLLNTFFNEKGALDWERDYFSENFPRIVNCSFGFGLQKNDEISEIIPSSVAETSLLCMVPGNIKNEMLYFGFYCWIVVFTIILMVREVGKIRMFIKLQMEIQSERMRQMVWQFVPGDTHTQAHIHIHNLGAFLTDFEYWFLVHFKYIEFRAYRRDPIYSEFIRCVVEVLYRWAIHGRPSNQLIVVHDHYD